MEKYKLFFILSLLSINVSFGQSSFYVSARAIALASGVATLNDISVVGANPTVLSYQKNKLISIQNGSRTTTREIQKNALILGIPLRKGVVGFSIQSYGNKVYSTFSGGVSYAMVLSEVLRVGAYFGSKNCSIEQYGSRSSLDVTLALQGKITERLSYGMSLQSIHRPSISMKAIFPTILCVGVKYVSSLPKWNIYSEIEKSLFIPMRLKIACEYFISPSFCFRTGWMSNAYQVSAGIGAWIKKKCRIDFGSTWQPILGVTIQSGLVFSTKSNDSSEE